MTLGLFWVSCCLAICNFRCFVDRVGCTLGRNASEWLTGLSERWMHQQHEMACIRANVVNLTTQVLEADGRQRAARKQIQELL